MRLGHRQVAKGQAAEVDQVLATLAVLAAVTQVARQAVATDYRTAAITPRRLMLQTLPRRQTAQTETAEDRLEMLAHHPEVQAHLTMTAD
jgi:hypothetical protein